MAVTHIFVSAKSDGGDATLVRPSNWNASHTGTIDDTMHGVRTIANAHAHANLSSIGVDDHHTQLHHTAHEAGGADVVVIDATLIRRASVFWGA